MAITLTIVAVWAMRKHDGYYDIPWHTQVGAGGVVSTISLRWKGIALADRETDFDKCHP